MLFYIYFFDLPSFELFVLWIKFCVRFFFLCVHRSFIISFSLLLFASRRLLGTIAAAAGVQQCWIVCAICNVFLYAIAHTVLALSFSVCIEVFVLSAVWSTHGWNNETNKVYKKNRSTLTHILSAVEWREREKKCVCVSECAEWKRTDNKRPILYG